MIAAAAVLLALLLGGAGCVVAGVWLLAGMPWGLIAGGCFALAGGALLRLGLGR